MSTIDTPDGKPWLESTIIGQTLATLGLVLAAVLPSLLGTRKDAAVVREQVQNSHTINQRDDMDQKHDSVVELISAFSARMDDKFQAVDSNIRGVRKDVGRLADGHASMDERLRKQERVMHGVQHSVDGLDRKFAPLEVNAKTGEIQIIKPPADTVAPTEE
jgi:type II secretory pathway component PulK